MELVIVVSISLITPTALIILFRYGKKCYNGVNKRTSQFKFKLFEDKL